MCKWNRRANRKSKNFSSLETGKFFTLKTTRLTQFILTSKAAATPAIFYSDWQFDILKAILRQKPKVVARVARCPQYLQHVAKS